MDRRHTPIGPKDIFDDPVRMEKDQKIDLPRVDKELPSKMETFDLPRLEKELPSKKEELRIERIYYVNLDKNAGRRAFMDSWLGNQTATSIPFHRVKAVSGESSGCIPRISTGDYCRGASGLSMTQLKIFDTLNKQRAKGLTMVLEDDYQIKNLSQVETLLNLLPDDFDIVRFDCWERFVPSTFKYLRESNPMIWQTAHYAPCNQSKEECNFCGGTHAMIYRDSSVPKLYNIWSKRPFDDIDCRLTTLEIKSYCINYKKKRPIIGRFYHPPGEVTNIPKNSPQGTVSKP